MELSMCALRREMACQLVKAPTHTKQREIFEESFEFALTLILAEALPCDCHYRIG